MEFSRKGLIISGIVILLFALFPLVAGTEHTLNLFILLFITIILAQSWNVLGGYAGQISLGNAAFFGVGALSFHFLAWRAGFPFYLALLAGGGAAVLLASFIGIPALRFRGAYFAMGTLALAEALRITVGNLFPLTVYIPTAHIVGYKLLSRYYLALIVALITQGVAYCMIRSKIGLAMMAIRDNDEAADASGVNLFKYKFIALAFSSFFSGLAGGVFAYYQISILPTFLFSPQWTFEPLVAASVGGSGTLLGPIIGSIFLIVLTEIFALTLGKGYLIIFGGLFIFVVLFLPGGLIEASRRIQRHFLRKEGIMTKKKGIIFLGLLLAIFSLKGSALADPLEEGKKFLTEGLRTFQKEPLLKARINFEESLKAKKDDPKLYYLFAQSLNGLAYVEELQGNKDGAFALIEEGVKAGKRSTELDDSFSDAHRLLATFYGRMIAIKGGMMGAMYGSQNEDEIQRALQLDNQNAQAHLELGIARINTPPQFGGDIEVGIKAIEKALSIDPNLDMAYYHLGRAFLKKGDKGKAQEILQKGLQINPANGFVKRELDRL